MTDLPVHDIFVSYVEADSAWVEGYLLHTFDNAGVRWHSEEAFRLGTPRILEFEQAMQQSKRTLLILSPAYLAASFNQFLDFMLLTWGAETARWPVIAILLQPVALPPHLQFLRPQDATDPAAWPQVIARLLDDLDIPVPAPAPPPLCPYPGMVPFDEQDAGRFFGRDEEIADIRRRLRHQNFLMVIGPSGSGKSSLINAGLLPALRASQQPAWDIRSLRPGSQPLARLQAALGDSAAPHQAEARPLLLVIDQFEELFVQAAKADQPAFIARLKSLRQESNCKLVLTMRADFYPDLMHSDLWPVDPSQRLEIGPLRGEALRRAIKQPATDASVFLEPGLLERLLADAANEPGALPLLQEAMVLLWESMQQRLLPLYAYERLGTNDRSGLAVAMANKADATLAALPADQQEIARRVFVWLVQFGEGRADTRRQLTVAELRTAKQDPAVFDAVLQHLAANRLLILSGSGSDEDRKVDIAHEMLIVGWPMAQGWVQARRTAEITRRRIEHDAVAWQQHQRDASYLLRGMRLTEARVWAAQNQADLTTDIDTLLAASQRRANIIRFGKALALAALICLAAIFPARWLWENSLRRAASSPMVEIPAGAAILGSDAETAEPRASPARTVTLPAFAIDRYEVSYRQYRLCVQAGRCAIPLEPAEAVGIADAPANWPVTWVTAYQAAAFCRWLGRRLPSEAEWERAARGSQGRPWPWGDQPPTPDNVHIFVDGFIERIPNSVTAVDDPRYAGGATPPQEGGIMHLVGNVAEWTRTPSACSERPYDCPQLWDETSKERSLFARGLGYSDQLVPTDLATLTIAQPASAIFFYDNTGFRCARSLP